MLPADKTDDKENTFKAANEGDRKDCTNTTMTLPVESSDDSEDIFFDVKEPPNDVKTPCKFKWNNLLKTEGLHNRMDQLIWRDVAKTRKICASGLIVLLGFAQFSAISLLPCWLMLILLGFLTIRQREAHHE